LSFHGKTQECYVFDRYMQVETINTEGIFVFALQKWLRERVTMLRSTRYRLSCYVMAEICACVVETHVFDRDRHTSSHDRIR
jgi:hypothetical protein